MLCPIRAMDQLALVHRTPSGLTRAVLRVADVLLRGHASSFVAPRGFRGPIRRNRTVDALVCCEDVRPPRPADPADGDALWRLVPWF